LGDFRNYAKQQVTKKMGVKYLLNGRVGGEAKKIIWEKLDVLEENILHLSTGQGIYFIRIVKI
jgi:TolB-like protein